MLDDRAAMIQGPRGMDLDSPEVKAAMLGMNPVEAALLSVDELAEQIPPEPLIGEVLSQGSLAVLYGRWATFKSFIALDWAMRIGSGMLWEGRSVARGPVIYVAAEGIKGMRKRAKAWGDYYPMDGSPDVLFHPGPVDLLRDSQVEHLVKTVRKIEPKLVIFDTLNRSLGGGEENSSSDMGKAIAAAFEVQQAADTTVLIIHHTGKDGDLRGHSSLPGAADHIIKTWVPDDNPENVVVLYSRKNKDDEPFDPIRLKAKVVKIGDATTCVITGTGWNV